MGRQALPTLPVATAGELVETNRERLAAVEAEHNERRELAIAEFGDGLPWSLEHYEAEIKHEMRRGCEAFLRAGRYLVVVRECATHGEFGGMVDRLGIAPRQAQRMMEAARRMAALPNASRATHLITATGTVSKLVELLSLPEDEFAELAAEGESKSGLSIDDVARMTRDELRAAVREARADIDAKDSRSQDRERRIEHLEKELRKARGERARATPDQVSTKLRDRVQIAAQQFRCDIVARSDGDDVSSLSQAIHELRAHAAEQGDASAHDVYLGGLIGELLTELRVLRDQHCLPIVRDHGDPAWMTGN